MWVNNPIQSSYRHADRPHFPHQDVTLPTPTTGASQANQPQIPQRPAHAVEYNFLDIELKYGILQVRCRRPTFSIHKKLFNFLMTTWNLMFAIKVSNSAKFCASRKQIHQIRAARYWLGDLSLNLFLEHISSKVASLVEQKAPVWAWCSMNDNLYS